MEDAILERLLESFVANAPSSSALKIAGRFDDPLTDNEIKIFDEILLRLSRVEQLEVRAKLASRLSGLSRGPSRTVKELCYDLDSEVAAPLLTKSMLVLDEDLISIAHTRSQQHLLAIAERPHLDIPVTDVVVWRGAWPVLRTLSANRTARFSPTGLVRLAAVSQGDGHITVALTKREDVPPMTRKALLTQFRQMVAVGRSPLCGEHSDIRLNPEAAPAIDPGQPASGAGVSKAETLSDASLRDARIHVQHLARVRPLTVADVTCALTHSHLAEALVLIGRLAQVDLDLLTTVLTGDGPLRHPALLILKAADLPWEVAERVLQEVQAVMRAAGRAARSDPSAQRQAYGALTRKAAQRDLRLVRFRSMMRVIDGGM